MLKFLFLLFLTGFLIYSVSNILLGYLRKSLGLSIENPHRKNTSFKKRTPPTAKNGEMDIEFVSKDELIRRHKNDHYKGGEYIDYEETS